MPKLFFIILLLVLWAGSELKKIWAAGKAENIRKQREEQRKARRREMGLKD